MKVKEFVMGVTVGVAALQGGLAFTAPGDVTYDVEMSATLNPVQAAKIQGKGCCLERLGWGVS